ncbi:helix-turn-helix domain-containing protein [Actinomadura keratinilytica]|uniref:helix-turn-helix domain-containing protein n=1 Tax=Actinomadura keratinilytica TaxID=547461 RepID=UPI00362149BC
MLPVRDPCLQSLPPPHRRSAATCRALRPDRAPIGAYPRRHGGTGPTAVPTGCARRRRDPRRHVLRHPDAPAGGPAGPRPGLGGPGRVRGRDPAPRHRQGDPHVARRHAGRRAVGGGDHRGTDHPRRRGDRHGVAGTPRPARRAGPAAAGPARHRRRGGRRTVRTGPHHHGRPRPGRTGDQHRRRRRRPSPGAAPAGFRRRPAGTRRRRALAGPARPDRRPGLPEPAGQGGPARRRRRPGDHRPGPGPVPRGRPRRHRRRRSPHRSWQQARTALRFTTPRQPVVLYDDLGALALLAEIPSDTARANADVAAISRIAADSDDLQTLDAYCATGSLRQAAGLLHLHHSSIARRLEQIGKALGIELTQPAGLTRARLALTTWRLLNGN